MEEEIGPHLDAMALDEARENVRHERRLLRIVKDYLKKAGPDAYGSAFMRRVLKTRKVQLQSALDALEKAEKKGFVEMEVSGDGND